MQPTDQTSTEMRGRFPDGIQNSHDHNSHDSLALKYAFGFSMISGALYQRVATYSVSTPLWS